MGDIPVGEGPVGLEPEFPVPPLANRIIVEEVGQERSSGNLTEMPVQSIGRWNETPSEELLDRTRLQILGNICVTQQGRQFTRKRDTARLTVEVEGLLSEPIAGKEQLAPDRVID